MAFNNHLLIIHQLSKGEDPLKVHLIFIPFWVYIHDVPPRFFSEVLVKQLGNFISRFLEYDSEGLARGQWSYMHIRVCMDIWLPLKRKKRLLFSPRNIGYVFFRYEHLTLFCFFWSKLRHNDSFVRIECFWVSKCLRWIRIYQVGLNQNAPSQWVVFGWEIAGTNYRGETQPKIGVWGGIVRGNLFNWIVINELICY